MGSERPFGKKGDEGVFQGDPPPPLKGEKIRGKPLLPFGGKLAILPVNIGEGDPADRFFPILCREQQMDNQPFRRGKRRIFFYDRSQSPGRLIG